MDYEKLGVFYLGRQFDGEAKKPLEPLVLYPSKHLTTHAVCIGMTGSGKTGLCLSLVEEAAIDQIPVLAIDPKGDLANLLLTFPELDAPSFAPWVEAGGDAEAEAKKWREGLASWHQDGARIRRLRESAELKVYTPGSRAGVPLSIVQSLAAPELDEADLLRDRVQATVSSLLALCGIDSDPIQGREHILLSALVERAWRQGRDLDLAALVHEVQKPPIDRVGALDIDTFFPAKERLGLSMALNNLLASPAFASWQEGVPIDPARLLYTDDGRPRVAIVNIAHLDERERMFFVTLLLEQVLAWVRAQSGTSSLRAILYMDEVFGYLPPVATPPSKRPLLTLLKQARAFGLGVVLATQNPVDLDYKGLANAGTWFIGRLQTERDKARVMEGLEGASASAGRTFDRAAMERTLAGLGNRVFLLHEVHEDRPILFQTRWTLSYLRGPLSRDEIRRLMDPVRPAASPAKPAITASGEAGARPLLPPEVVQLFAPAAGEVVYAPHVVAEAEVRFFDAKLGVDHTETGLVVAPIGDGPVAVEWDRCSELKLSREQLAAGPAAVARFRPPPAAAAKAKSYATWGKELAAWLHSHQAMELWRSPSTGEVSRPGEREGELRARLSFESREDRDRDADKLRAKYAPKLEALDEKLRRARQTEAQKRDQARTAQLDTALSVGASLLGALVGGRRRSLTTGARAAGRAVKQSRDVTRAGENVAALEARRAELEQRLAEDLAALGHARDPQTELLEPVVVRPKKSDVRVRFVALLWKPVL